MYVPRALRSQNTPSVQSNSSTTAISADRTAPASRPADVELQLPSNVDANDLSSRTCSELVSTTALPSKASDDICDSTESSTDTKTSSRTSEKPKKIGCRDPAKKVSKSGRKSKSDSVEKRTNADEDKAEIESKCNETAATADGDVLTNERSEGLHFATVTSYRTPGDSVLSAEFFKSGQESTPDSVVAKRSEIGSKSSETAAATYSNISTERREDLDLESVRSRHDQDAVASSAGSGSDCDADNSGPTLTSCSALTDVESLKHTEATCRTVATVISHDVDRTKLSIGGRESSRLRESMLTVSELSSDVMQLSVIHADSVTESEARQQQCHLRQDEVKPRWETDQVASDVTTETETEVHLRDTMQATVGAVDSSINHSTPVHRESDDDDDADNACADVASAITEARDCSHDTAEATTAADNSSTDSTIYRDANGGDAAAAAAADDDDDDDDDESWEKMFDESGEMLHEQVTASHWKFM